MDHFKASSEFMESRVSIFTLPEQEWGQQKQGVELLLRDFMDSQEGWGRTAGRRTLTRMIQHLSNNPAELIYRVSFRSVSRTDVTFAHASLVELMRRRRTRQGFYFVDLTDPDLMINWHAAGLLSQTPLITWTDKQVRLLGTVLTEANRDAFAFALSRLETRASELSREFPGMSLAHASQKLKRLWQQGFIIRREITSRNGGIEYAYHRIG